MTAYPVTTEIMLERDGGWLTVWFNRPEAKNALTSQMTTELAQVFAAVRGDRTLRGITLRGKGGVFCAGGDIKGFGAAIAGNAAASDIVALSRKAGELFHQLNELPQVVVALVEGVAMAGGLGLACAADFVAATTEASFGLTETRIGIPPAQIAPLVVDRIGLAAARRVMLTARRFGAEEAAKLGVVDHLAADPAGLEDFEREIRAAVAGCAPGANAFTKEILLATRTLVGDDLVDLAAMRFATALLGDEGREGVAAFVEKRKPRWAQ